jgi:hypothetical protein
MNAYVGVTDRDWFDFLSAQTEINEVNFWQPNPWGGDFGVLRRGEPFLFKLKAPVNAIAGGDSSSITPTFHSAWPGTHSGSRTEQPTPSGA